MPNMREMKLTIQDECIATWMAINNTATAWRLPEFDKQHFYDGIMIQVGEAEVIPQHAGTENKAEFGGVTLQGRKVLKFSAAEFSKDHIWINVVTDLTGPKTPPTLPVDSLKLFPDEPLTTHRYFRPRRGGITIWQQRNEESAYSVKAKQSANEKLHNAFEFTFNQNEESCYVEIIRNGVPHPDSPMRGIFNEIIVAIKIKGPGHGDGNNPPYLP